MGRVPEIIAINRAARIAMTDDDVILHFDSMLDEDGDETNDPNEAIVAVAPHPDGTWWQIDLRCFESRKPH